MQSQTPSDFEQTDLLKDSDAPNSTLSAHMPNDLPEEKTKNLNAMPNQDTAEVGVTAQNPHEKTSLNATESSSQTQQSIFEMSSSLINSSYSCTNTSVSSLNSQTPSTDNAPALSLRPTTIIAQSAEEQVKRHTPLRAEDVLSQTAHILSQKFGTSSSLTDNLDPSSGENNKPQLNELDPSQWSSQTAAYNQKVLNRIKVQPLCDPVGKPMSNPQGTPASKPFLDLPTDLLNTTLDCHDGICEVIEGENSNAPLQGLGDLASATAPQPENLTEPLLPEDISASVEPLPPLTEALPPLTEELPPLTEALPPLTDELPPLTESLPPLSDGLTNSLDSLDQNHLPQSDTALHNHIQASQLNLSPLSQKSASQAILQGANSSNPNTNAQLSTDLAEIEDKNFNLLNQSMHCASSFEHELNKVAPPNHGLMQHILTPAIGLKAPSLNTDIPAAQVTAMALQAAQAQISQKNANEPAKPIDLKNFQHMPGMPNAKTPMASMASELESMPSTSVQHNSMLNGSYNIDPMFRFQQSMAQGYGSTIQDAPSHASQETGQLHQTDHSMSLHSVHSFNKINRMPGLVLYKLKNNTVFYDGYAAEFLGIGSQAGDCTLRQFLHMIGRPMVHDLIVRLKPLRDELKISADNICTSMNVLNLSCVLPHGVCKGATVYVRVAAFFDEQSNVKYFTFTFMRQMPNNMAFIPDLLTNNTSFAWLVQEDKLSLSQHYYKLLGYPEQDEPLILSFSTWENTLVHPHDRAAIQKIMPIIDSPAEGNSFEICYRSRKINGTYIWTKSIGTVVARDANGKATRVIGVNCDINEMVDGYDRLRSKVYTDVLTGLKNRTYLVQHVRDFIQPQMQPLSILFFDATALKLYNDYLGHSMGDKLLFSIANILNENIAFENELIRISGDEMLCILPMCDELMLQMVMDDISTALEAYNANAPVRMPVFFSMGNITINLNTQLYNRMRMQYAKQLKAQDQAHLNQHKMFNQHVALNRTLAWQNWSPDEKQLDKAYELFFQAVQQADKNMQEAKLANREAHYALIRAYIESTLHKHIDLDDKRLLNIDRGMLA